MPRRKTIKPTTRQKLALLAEGDVREKNLRHVYMLNQVKDLVGSGVYMSIDEFKERCQKLGIVRMADMEVCFGVKKVMLYRYLAGAAPIPSRLRLMFIGLEALYAEAGEVKNPFGVL